MRYLNRYDRIKIYIYKYVDKIQQLGMYNAVKSNLKFNYNLLYLIYKFSIYFLVCIYICIYN